MKIAFIGLRMFPASRAGLSGIDVRGEKIIYHFSKTSKVVVYVRDWVKHNKKKYKSIIVEPIFTFQNKYVDTFIYSLLASIRVSFSNSDLVFYEGTSSTFFCFLPRLFKKKVIVTVHTQEFLRSKWNLLGQTVLYISEYIGVTFAHRVISVSRSISTYLRAQYGIKSKLIPYFIENKRNVSAKLLKKFQLNKNRYILYLGRFTEEKRVDWLIKAFKEIKPKGVSLILAGGNVQDTTYIKYLKNLAGNLNNIKMIGYVFDNEKEIILSSCKLFVSPSSIEGCSLALSEALGYKKQILISASISGVIPAGNKKSVFKTYDYFDFKRKLQHLISEKTNKNQLPNFLGFIKKREFFKNYSLLLRE